MNESPADAPRPSVPPELARRYWRANLRLVASLLVVWAAVSFGAGLVFAEPLNAYELPGTAFPLGFWFAQQGSIVTFCVLVFVYAWRISALEERLGLRSSEEGRP